MVEGVEDADNILITGTPTPASYYPVSSLDQHLCLAVYLVWGESKIPSNIFLLTHGLLGLDIGN